MQMPAVSASSDKLATQVQSNATVSVMIYGIILGNIAAKLGQNKAMVVSSVGGRATGWWTISGSPGR